MERSAPSGHAPGHAADHEGALLRPAGGGAAALVGGGTTARARRVGIRQRAVRKRQRRRIRNRLLALTLVLCAIPRPASTVEVEASPESAIGGPGGAVRQVETERGIGVPFTLVTLRYVEDRARFTVHFSAPCYDFLAACFLLGAVHVLRQGRERGFRDSRGDA